MRDFEQDTTDMETVVDRIIARLDEPSSRLSVLCEAGKHRLCPTYGWSYRHMAVIDCECDCHAVAQQLEGVAA